MYRRKAERFVESVIRNCSNPLILQVHDFPDYDAVAAAYGLKEYLYAFGIDAYIVYHGEITPFMLQNVIVPLQIPLNRARSFSAHQASIITVDCQPHNKNITCLDGHAYAGYLDHHILNNIQKYPCVYYRLAGASSTLVAELFFRSGITMRKEVATALAVGIMTDTNSLTRGVSKNDVLMYYELFVQSDIALIHRAVINKFSAESIDYLKQALASVIFVHGRIAVTVLEEVRDHNTIGILGDFFLSIQGVSVSIVANQFDGGTFISVRSYDTISAYDIMKSLCVYGGDFGGHIQMAAGMIPGVINSEMILDVLKSFLLLS